MTYAILALLVLLMCVALLLADSPAHGPGIPLTLVSLVPRSLYVLASKLFG